MSSPYKLPLFVLLHVFLLIHADAQQWVSTQPEGKRVILEEFTGVRCGSCPDAHQRVASLVAAYPGRVWVVGLHPKDDWHTVPLSTADPDLRHGFANNFFHSGFFGGTIYMPSGMVNRREWTTGVRAVGRERWAGLADSILQEKSPVNAGLNASYDPVTQELRVDAEVYFTEKVETQLSLYVVLLEDSIIAGQAGQGAQYVHFNVLRAALTGPWGAVIADSADAGTLWSRTFFWNAESSGVNMAHARVLVYVREQGSGELLTGEGAVVQTKRVTALEEGFSPLKLAVYPNPATENSRVRVALPETMEANWILYDALGRKLGEGREWGNEFLLPKLKAGTYVLQVLAGAQQGNSWIWVR